MATHSNGRPEHQIQLVPLQSSNWSTQNVLIKECVNMWIGMCVIFSIFFQKCVVAYYNIFLFFNIVSCITTCYMMCSDDTGREVISRFSTSLQTNSTFYTDSNGREILQRMYILILSELLHFDVCEWLGLCLLGDRYGKVYEMFCFTVSLRITA